MIILDYIKYSVYLILLDISNIDTMIINDDIK